MKKNERMKSHNFEFDFGILLYFHLETELAFQIINITLVSFEF